MLYQPDSLKWKDALRRATNGSVEARLILMSSGDNCCVESYVTNSADHPNALQQVGIVWTHDGLSSVGCTCRTAQQGKPCQHAAAAVMVAFETTIDDDELVTVVEGVWEPGFTIPCPVHGAVDVSDVA